LSEIEKLKLKALLIFSQIRQSKEVLALDKLNEGEGGSADKVNTQQVEDELNGYNNSLAEVLKQIQSKDPNEVENGYVLVVCDHYVTQGKIAEAKAFVDASLSKKGTDPDMDFYRRTLDEPDVTNITDSRRKELEQQVISEIADPVKRAMNMGAFYQRENNFEQAKGEFEKVINLDSWDLSQAITPEQTSAISYLFEIALSSKDFEQAQKAADVARHYNIDSCDGQYFGARISIAKEDYKDALLRLDDCITKRPVFSYGYMLRSKVNASLGNDHASLEDIRKAASLNITNGDIARDVAVAIYLRNEKLGSAVSSDQKLEARTALERAMILNPVDVQLRSLYAEYISVDEPERALSIRQRLQKASPSVENALLLARLTSKLGFAEADTSRQKALFEMTESAYEQAKQIDPSDKTVLYNYAEFLDKIGQKDRAKKLIDESGDSKMVWSHYYQSGQIGKAKEVLDKLYKESPKDLDVVKGELLVAENQSNVEGIKKYSNELLALEENEENRLFKIRAYLKVGLIKEAEEELVLFKSKYPDNEKVLVLETWLKMSQGQLDKASELAKLNVQKNENDFTSWRLKGEINLMLGNYVQAISDLKQSKMLNDEPSVRISLAKAYLRANQEDEAITELVNTADVVTAPSGAKRMLEQIYLRSGKKDLLQKFYSEMLKDYPDSVYWYNKAGAFAVSQGNMANAEQLYKQAWDISNKTGNDKAMALDGYLMILVRQKEYSKVLELGRQYIDGEFAPLAYFRMAEAQLASGDKKTAIEYCRKAVDKAEVNESYASEMLQKVYGLIGSEEVVSICQEKLTANPESLYANFSMFNISVINGQYNKAVEYIDKCIAIVGSDNIRKTEYIGQKVGVLELAYKKTSDKVYLQKAIREYESLLVEMPNNISVLNNLAYMLAETGEKLDKALEYGKRAYDLMPNNANIMDTYSYVLLKNGKNKQAEEYLQSALQQYEKDSISAPSDVYKHLGVIKEALGRSSEAVAAYQQALEIGDKTMLEEEKAEIRKAIERLSK
ncbi:MAG TPA: tetratricopeptide repeat protein, partial [Sedimentisphaerales bacterium]|nr:tetratricopeptide repeat protein [Sedimentisphaerales bacterium]